MMGSRRGGKEEAKIANEMRKSNIFFVVRRAVRSVISRTPSVGKLRS